MQILQRMFLQILCFFLNIFFFGWLSVIASIRQLPFGAIGNLTDKVKISNKQFELLLRSSGFIRPSALNDIEVRLEEYEENDMELSLIQIKEVSNTLNVVAGNLIHAIFKIFSL
jgi:hypothetical protein